jgi:hypothetical protein
MLYRSLKKVQVNVLCILKSSIYKASIFLKKILLIYTGLGNEISKQMLEHQSRYPPKVTPLGPASHNGLAGGWQPFPGKFTLKSFQNPPPYEEGTAQMKEACVGGDQALIAHHEAPKVPQPGEGPPDPEQHPGLLPCLEPAPAPRHCYAGMVVDRAPYIAQARVAWHAKQDWLALQAPQGAQGG